MPSLTKLLSFLEVVFNYIAKVTSGLLQMFGVKMDFKGGGAIAPTETQQNPAAAKPNIADRSITPKVDTTETDKAKDKNDKLSDSYNKVGDSAKDSADKVKESSDTMQGALAGIDELNILSFGSPGSDDSAADAMADALEDAEEAVPDYSDIGTGISDAILDGLETGFTGLPGLLTSPVDDVCDGIVNKLKGLFEPVYKAWEVMSPRLTKALADFKEQAKITFQELGNYLGSCWESGGATFLQHLAELALALSTVSFEVGTRLLKSFEDLFKYLDPKANNITKSMIDSLNEAAVVTRDFILGITEHFKNFMDIAGDDILKNFADTFHKSVTACAEVWTTFVKTLDGLLDHLDPISNEFTRVMLGNVNNAIVSVGDTLLGFSTLLENIRNNGRYLFAVIKSRKIGGNLKLIYIRIL